MASHEEKDKSSSNYKRNAGIVKFLGACICVCLVFCAGFFVRGNTSLLTSLGFGGLAAQDQVQEEAVLSQESLSSRIEEIESLLSQDSLDSYDLSKTTTQVINAYISSIDDPYLRYFDEANYQEYLKNASEPNNGVGVLFGESDGACYVVDVFEGSQAALAGIQVGDYVESIDGESRDVWSMPEVVNAISRNEGESVYITWCRPSSLDAQGDTVFNTTLEYNAKEETNIEYELSDDVAYITVRQLAFDSASVVQSALNEAQNQGAGSFVLDLRDVPGGYLTEAVEIASLFIPSGTIVQIQTSDNLTTKTADGKSVTSAPLVVLVNGHTTGSAEVLALALQETERASIVGVQTQGKGTVQVMQQLSFGGALRYTAATYLSPSGRALDAQGVTPDIMVSDPDNQKTVAIEVAQSQIS